MKTTFGNVIMPDTNPVFCRLCSKDKYGLPRYLTCASHFAELRPLGSTLDACCLSRQPKYEVYPDNLP